MTDFARFFDSLYGDNTGYAILVTMGDDDTPSSQRPFEWPKERSFVLKYAKVRGEDEDVYIATSLSSSEERGAETATVTRAVYADGDTCPPEVLRLPPSLTLTTSPGRYHYYWFLDETVSAQEASDASRRISYAHREDGMDLGFARSKLLRTPGSVNNKYDEPFHVQDEWTEYVYTLDTINDAYGDIDIAPHVETNSKVPDSLSESKIRDLEERLDVAGLSDLYLQRPEEGQSWSERLFKLELELFRLGFTAQEVFCVCRESAANKYNPENAGGRTATGVKIPKRNDPNGVLWREVQKAEAEYNATKDIEVEKKPSKAYSKPSFLSPDERKYVMENPTFIDEYTHWVAQRTDAAETYQRSLAWMLLSTYYGGKGYLPLRWGRTELNLWVLILGDTTQTRKSTSKSFYLRGVHALEQQTGETYDIGSEATPEALIKALGERDGLVSVLHTDEVVGMFREFLLKSYMSGAIEKFTELYDGSVRVVLRATKDSGNKNRARTVFNFVGVGIRKHTAEVLTKSHFESGFLARMLWSVADPKPRQPGSEDLEFADEMSEKDKADFDAEIKQVLRPIIMNAATFSTDHPVEIRFDTPALKRYNKWAEEAMQAAEHYGDDGILTPSFQRMKTSIAKAAALLAMHDGVTTVTLKHLLPTLAQAESWFNDMVRMATEVSSSEFERRCNDIEGFIASGDNKTRLDSAVRKRYAKFKPAEYDEIVRALQAQGRVRRSPGNGQAWEVL